MIAGATVFFSVFLATVHPQIWPAGKQHTRDPQVERVIEKLVRSMTLEEKVGQVIQPSIVNITPGEVRDYHIGSILNGGGGWRGDVRKAKPQEWLALADAFYTASMDALAPFLVVLAAASQPTAGPTTLTLWPGYRVELPAGHCVELSRRVDFDLVYFHDRRAPNGPILVGIYAGHNPEDLECTEPVTRQWKANGLAFKSARGADGCAEFLIQDPKKPERGFLHIWFGPAAKDHQEAAEAVVASVHTAALPVYRPDDLPTCQ